MNSEKNNSTKFSKLMKKNSKNFSRNRKIGINQSLNGLSREKQLFNFKNSHLDSMRNSSVQSYFKPFENTFSVQRSIDENDNERKLQIKIINLEELLSEKDSTIDFLKRKINFTKINELKEENDVLYEEWKRMRQLIRDYMIKGEDEDLIEDKILNRVNISTRSENLSSIFKNKKNRIEELLEQNPKIDENKPDVQITPIMSSKVKFKEDPPANIEGNIIIKKKPK